MLNKETLLQKWQALPPNNLMRDWQMEIAEVTEESVTITMPVTEKVTQVDGVLHGGATLALAETAGSIGRTYFTAMMMNKFEVLNSVLIT